MKKCLVYLLIISLIFSCINKKKDNDNRVIGNEEVTIIVDSLPKGHDFEKDLFVSGDFEGWSGGRVQFKLQRKNKKYSITIPKYKEHISFKLTLGNWENVECAVNENPIENRTYSFYKQSDTIRVSVAQWHDFSHSGKQFTASKNVQVFAEAFEMPQLHRTRKISVYLPPNYDITQDRFPVLYMQDGQNIFDESTSYSGEWEVDETVNKLCNETGFALIVVAIDHGGDKRQSEYSPWDNEKYGQGEGKQYVDFLVHTLKPKIDASFRTKSDSESTAIMGSSLGGLISHYAVFQYPDVFGKAGVFSPSYWYAEDCFDFTKTQVSKALNSEVYMLVGVKEGQDVVDNVQKMGAILKENAFPENNLMIKIIPEGVHSESFWKLEFEAAIKWMFKIDTNENI